VTRAFFRTWTRLIATHPLPLGAAARPHGLIVLVEPTHLKNMLRVKLDPFPKVLGVKIRKTFETTT